MIMEQRFRWLRVSVLVIATACAGGAKQASDAASPGSTGPVTPSEEPAFAEDAVSYAPSGGAMSESVAAAAPAPPPEVAAESPAPERSAEDSAPSPPVTVPRAKSRADRPSMEREATEGRGMGALGAPGTSRSGYGAGGGAASSVAAPAMKAGRHDDNAQYNRFLQFLAENRALVPQPVDVSERIVVRAGDREGKSLFDCAVKIVSMDGKTLSSGTTYADGRTQFFPADASSAAERDYTARVRCGKEERSGQIARGGRREVEVRFPSTRSVPARVPVDIAIVLDTTGSMGGQIERLKRTLQAIHLQLSHLTTQPHLRFALVAYRDRGDDYVTRVIQFTDDVEHFQRVIDELDADGGGDTPEDLQAALDEAMHRLQWRQGAVRMGFVIADAVPHTDYGQAYDYRAAMRESLERGIKWVTIGAGGLPRSGEVIFRQIAQYTMGEYVFVTEGGGGDSEGGAGEASHHVGSNYKTENLDQAIVRIVRRELSHLTDAPADFDETLVARRGSSSDTSALLTAAAGEALRQLVDYSSLRLAERTPVAIAPVSTAAARYEGVAEYLSDQLTLQASRNSALRVVERDLRAVSQELKVQLSDLFDAKDTVPIGKMVGAEVLVVGKLMVTGAKAELFAKLVRVETGEVLSVSKVAFADDLQPLAATDSKTR